MYKRVIDHLPLVALWYETERMIYRRLYDHFLVRGQQSIYYHTYTLDNSRYVGHPLGFGLPAVMLAYPIPDRRPQFLRLHRIAKYGVLQAPAQRFDNERRSLKVHIGHPHRQQPVLSEPLLEGVRL